MKVSFEDAIKSLQDLIKINSVQAPATEGAPFGEGNVRALDYSLKLLESFGFKTKNGENYYGYGDVGDDSLPLFGILAHLDVVPISPTWQHDPFGGEIEDGYLYGRGTLDDKGPFISALYACAQRKNTDRFCQSNTYGTSQTGQGVGRRQLKVNSNERKI